MTNNSELTTDDTAIHRSSLMMVGLGDVQLEIHETFQALENEWMALQANSASSIYQHFDWVRLWTENVGARARIQPKLVVGSLNGEDLFILPLGIARRGPFSVATWRWGAMTESGVWGV